jgi:plasmid rolling circle replication initiator protein Rep
MSISKKSKSVKHPSPKDTATPENQGAGDFLTDYSTDSKDSKWDFHKSASQKISFFYQSDAEFSSKASRVETCADLLKFQFIDTPEGESVLKLRSAQFCRVRLCPVCQWRRSMLWRAKLFQNLPTLLSEQPNLKFVFLTLTVQNCEIENLSETLKNMNSAFSRLRKLKKFTSVVKGYIKATEVTKSKDGKAHPHFHIILAVEPKFFGRSFIKTSEWAEMWQSCLKVNYLPVCDARKIKVENGNLDSRAIIETLKYTTKVETLVEDKDWFLELTRQLERKRFLDTGGIFKNLLKEDVSQEEMLLQESDDENSKNQDEENQNSVFFGFNSNFQKYKKVKI